MKNTDFENIIKVSVLISASVIIAYLYLIGAENIWGFVRAISAGVSSASIFIFLYIKFLWRMPVFNKIAKRPFLSGTWQGTLKSDYKFENGEGVPPKEIFLVIRQDFLRIHIQSFTDRFNAESYVEAILYEESKGLKKLVYVYRQGTSDLGNQRGDEGTSELNILTNINPELEGRYWTNIKTAGELYFKKISETHIEKFSQGIDLSNKLLNT